MKDFYFSFADPDLPEGQQFLGACIVRAEDDHGAVTRTHVLGINPGGQAQFIEIPDDAPECPGKWRDKLLSREDIEAMDREMEGPGG